MPLFRYKAKKDIDQSVDGFIEAANKEEAIAKIGETGLFPVSVMEEGAESPDARGRKPDAALAGASGRRSSITSAQVLEFTRKLTTLIRARVELIESLRIIYEQTENLNFREVIFSLFNSLKGGGKFSQSLESFPEIFSPLFVSLIKAGEASGRLDTALEHMSAFLSRQESLRKKIMVALAYPVLLLCVGMASIFVLINFVIPRLKPIFAGLGDKLPLITKVVLAVSQFSSKSWVPLFSGIFLICVLIYARRGGGVFFALFKKVRKHIPVVKRLIKNQELNMFARSFCLLLKSGVPALSSLSISLESVEDGVLRSGLKKVAAEIASGESIAKSMGRFTGLPLFFIEMIAVGEESGRISEVLEEIADSYAEEIESDVELISSLIEPVLILCLGIVLGAIVLAVLLPTFQVTQMVR